MLKCVNWRPTKLPFSSVPADLERASLLNAPPREEDATQVKGYAATVRTSFPTFIVRTFVAYIVANKGYKFWEVK